MRIEFSVQGPAEPCDVAVTAAGSDRLGTVLPALREIAGAGPRATAWLGARQLHDDEPVAGSGLRSGAVVVFGAVPRLAPVAGLRTVHVVAGAPASSVLLTREGVSLGRDEHCDLVLADDRVSRQHARLTITPSGVTVHDCGSTNGTSVDGVPVPASGLDVGPGALVRVGDSVLTVRTPAARDAASVIAAGPTLQLRRAPADPLRPEPTVVDLAEPPARRPPRHVPWLAALVPAGAGAVLAWTTATPAFLLMSALTPLLLVANAAGERMHERRQRRRDEAVHSRRSAAVADRIAAELADEMVARRAELPDVPTLLEQAALPGRGLWQRTTPGLVVRVGTTELPARTRLRDGARIAAAGTVVSVPYPVELSGGVLGVTGPSPDVTAVGRWLVAQLAVRYAPSDLRIVIASGGSATSWQWCRWLPHVAAFGAPSDVVAMLARHHARPVNDEGESGPRTVVVVDAAEVGSGSGAALAELLEDGAPYGSTGIWLAAAESALPPACRTRLVGDGSPTSVVRDGLAGSTTTVLTERLDETSAAELARALAPYTESGGDGGIPDECRLGALLPQLGLPGGTAPIRASWTAAADDADTIIGVDARGPVTVDLDRDGPHAVIVGTTGAGKSELLRTLVLGLAAGHPPDELAFVLVDYKGGAAFGALAELPHTTDVVTDLDPTLTERALRSLGAELRRREQLFADAGVADLAGYRGRPRDEPVPRLVLVVDEFAELAAEHPDFVTGLVGVARRGRSLGVHLVLATQRPGAVSAEIRANAALRIALRVTDTTESLDLVGVPDAASIDPHRPGRAYLRIGDRITQVQTARVAPEPRHDRPVVEALGPWRRPPNADTASGQDELARAVRLLSMAARGIPKPRSPWLPPLPATLPLLFGGDGRAIGRLDLPDARSQPQLLLPPGGGVLVVGRARSGRTTALITMALTAAARHLPSELHLHVIDSDGQLCSTLRGLPHLGSAVSTGVAPELVPRLLDRLGPVRRQRRTLLLVDDWDASLGRYGDATGVAWSDLLARLVRTAGDDLLVAVTGGRSLLLPRTAGAFGTRLLLALDDVADYGMAGVVDVGGASASAPDPGGGIRAPDGARFRLASAADPHDAVQRLAGQRPAGHQRGDASGALRIRPLPHRVELNALRADVPARRGGMLIGVGGDGAEPCVLDLVTHGGRLLVAGPPRAGRSTALLTVVLEARRLGHDVAVWARARSPLRGYAEAAGARLVTGATATRPALLVVDDVESLDDESDELFTRWLRAEAGSPLAAVVAGRSDELATGYRPLVAAVRRERCGLLLRPDALDGDLLGIRLGTPVISPPPGRGVLVADPRWFTGAGPDVTTGADAVPVQVACAVPP